MNKLTNENDLLYLNHEFEIVEERVRNFSYHLSKKGEPYKSLCNKETIKSNLSFSSSWNDKTPLGERFCEECLKVDEDGRLDMKNCLVNPQLFHIKELRDNGFSVTLVENITDEGNCTFATVNVGVEDQVKVKDYVKKMNKEKQYGSTTN